MVKKVVIAAAGKGTRMLDLSKDKPKHLIEVGGRPFLSYLLDNLFLAGYDDVILVTGYKSEAMEKFKDNYLAPENGQINIKIINQFEIIDPDVKYGTACPLMCVDKEIKEQFLYICGDNLFSVEDLKDISIDDDFCYIAGIIQDHPEKYGVLVGQDFLEKIVEKPKEFVGNIVNAGLYKFTTDIFGKIPLVEKSPRGEYEITDAVSMLAKEGRVKIKKVKDYWQDFGNPEDIQKMSEFLNNGNNKGR